MPDDNISTPPTMAPTPGATDPSAQLDSQLQQLMQRTMAQRTHIPVPQQQQQQKMPYMQGPATTHAEGNQMFFHNLGALIGNAAQQAKQNQIKQATGVLQQLSNAHDKYQEIVISQGVTDPQEIQKKTVQLMGQAPEVQEILSDKKKMKQLQKLGQLDLFNPDAKQDVVHEAAKRVGKANKLQAAMKAMGQVIQQHKQQQQLKPPDQILNQIEGTAKLAPTDEKTEVALLGVEARSRLEQMKQQGMETQLNEKQREFDAKLAQDSVKLEQQQKQFDAKLSAVQKEKDQAIAERKFEATLRAQTVKDTSNLRIAAQKDMKAMPTGASRSMGEAATAILQHIDPISKEIDALDARGKLGVIAGRYDDFMTGKVGANDPDFARLRDDLSLLASGTLKAHFGSRGGAIMYDRFKAMFNQAGQSAENLKTGLDVVKDWMTVYQEMGKGTLPGEGTAPISGGPTTPATPKKDSLGIL